MPRRKRSLPASLDDLPQAPSESSQGASPSPQVVSDEAFIAYAVDEILRPVGEVSELRQPCPGWPRGKECGRPATKRGLCRSCLKRLQARVTKTARQARQLGISDPIGVVREAAAKIARGEVATPPPKALLRFSLKKIGKGGPTYRCTPYVIDKICEAVRNGTPLSAACRVAGVAERTAAGWLKEGRSLLERGERGEEIPWGHMPVQFTVGYFNALAEHVDRNAHIIQTAASQDWKAAAWLLRYGAARRWFYTAPQEVVQSGRMAVDVTVRARAQAQELSLEELHAERERLDAVLALTEGEASMSDFAPPTSGAPYIPVVPEATEHDAEHDEASDGSDGSGD